MNRVQNLVPIIIVSPKLSNKAALFHTLNEENLFFAIDEYFSQYFLLFFNKMFPYSAVS